MADNIAVTVGTGTTKTIAADEDGSSVLHQRVKVEWGADGTINETDTASGKPLPIQLRSSTGVAASYGSGASDTGTQRVTIDTGQLASLSTSAQAMSPGGYQVVGLASDSPGLSAAHDAVDSGNPWKVGSKATTSLSGLTLVANADRTDWFAGIDGVQIVRPHCNLEDIVAPVKTTCTAGADTSIVAAQGAGIKFYLTSVILYNGGATSQYVDITDASGGTIRLRLPLPASTGTIYNPPIPIPFSANTAVYANPSGTDNVDVCICGFKSKV